jgi:glycosyltransferase involved in cell wall biosynthesis
MVRPSRAASYLGRTYWSARTRVNALAGPLRSLRELGLSARSRFREARASPQYQAAYDKENPLVSVCVATYNRARLLRDRSVRSLLAQTYRNIEIIVVGDGCSDETAATMAEIDDPRLTFVNLEKRGDYPEDPFLRWMVAGTAALNHALSMAKGDFITHLDDDDEHAPERVEALLSHIVKIRADLLFHPFRYEAGSGEWRVNPAASFKVGQVTTSSIFYHNFFRHIQWDIRAYRYLEPGDWNRLRKLKFLGAVGARNPGIFLSHYRERNQSA